ncbi:type IV pilus biogenesis protein PilM [Aquibacillus kalidii]|uniref:type IV pilus biogenesis protein PilM n=1 Tax=Aquibacillus kalidii TaxID=2762597 RepID=UPI0016446207|nr:pilus assembly protein PilM [Aquibacillus kalidii]
MLINLNKQVNFVIKDRVVRYVVSSQPTIEGITDYGELVLEPGVMEDGKIIDNKNFQTSLEQLVKNKKWRNASLSFCVPDSFVTIREQLVPKGLSKEETKSYIHMELDASIRLPFQDPVVDFVLTGEEKDQSKILLFAYPKERINEFLKVFHLSGLKPKVADLSSLSLYRLYYKLDLPNENEHLLTIQWCKDATVLTAFKQNKPIFTRHIKSNLNRNSWVWDDTKNELVWTGEMEDLEQVISDQIVTIERFMDFYQYSVMDGTEQITKILLSGDFPNLNQVITAMRERFTLPIESMNKLEEAIHHPARFAEVIGLAIKAKK